MVQQKKFHNKILGKAENSKKTPKFVNDELSGKLQNLYKQI